MEWFFELIKKYAKIFINEGLNFYRRKEKNELINNFLLINENFIGPIIEKLIEIIYMIYLR